MQVNALITPKWFDSFCARILRGGPAAVTALTVACDRGTDLQTGNSDRHPESKVHYNGRQHNFRRYVISPRGKASVCYGWVWW